MNDKDMRCALCAKMPESDEPAVLAIGNYGMPRYICEECEAEIDTATLSRDYGEAAAAIERLGAKMVGYGKDDPITVDAIKDILERASKRAAAIKGGSYDFALDESEESNDGGFDEIPEELRETEEDRELDRKEAEANKKFDKILNWVWVAVFLAFGVVFALKMLGKI